MCFRIDFQAAHCVLNKAQHMHKEELRLHNPKNAARTFLQKTSRVILFEPGGAATEETLFSFGQSCQFQSVLIPASSSSYCSVPLCVCGKVKHVTALSNNPLMCPMCICIKSDQTQTHVEYVRSAASCFSFTAHTASCR